MAKDKPHGPVSERLMRKFYGPSGYVSNEGGGNLADPLTLPACMAPDGADPCASYTRLAADNEKLRKELDRLLAIEDATPSQPQEANWQPVPPRACIKPTHEAADAFWKYWRENGETHKHGYYESTWGAINAALAHGWTQPQEAQPVDIFEEDKLRLGNDATHHTINVIEGRPRELTPVEQQIVEAAWRKSGKRVSPPRPTQEAQPLPPGFKLVPVELPDDMLRYAMAALGTGSPRDAELFRAFWLHALAAAPQNNATGEKA